METLDQFTARLSEAVGCYWHDNKTNNSLDKYSKKPRPRTKNTFGWVSHRPRRDAFRVSTYEYLAGPQARLDAEYRKEGAHYVVKDRDYGESTGIYYFVKCNSFGHDFVNTVRALRGIIKNL